MYKYRCDVCGWQFNEPTKDGYCPNNCDSAEFTKLPEHTQGEWNNNLHDGNVYASNGIVIANCYSSLLSPSTIKANAELIVKAVNERQALLDENEKVKRLLHDLTPGGSEFYNDPEYCAKWVRENREENHYTLSNIIKELKESKQALLDSHRELKEALDELSEQFLTWQLTHPDTWDEDDDKVFNKVVKALNNAKNIQQ